jgi:tetratricopeptide (TPR) repeat protein
VFRAFPRVLGLLILCGPLPPCPAAAAAADPAAALERAVSAAETSLRRGELQAAEGHYRTAVAEGSQLLQSLALLHLRMGEPAPAVEILERLAANNPKDLELAFALAGGYLALKKVDPAARLFAEIVRERPIPQTHVLIGRTWRDHGEFARARVELRAALEQDPRVRRAHYYLGRVALEQAGRAGIDEALQEFKAEVGIAPEDPLANLELGVALVQRQLFAEGLPALEVASRSEPPQARAFAYLGRAQLGLDRPDKAAASLARALELARAQGANRPALLAIHLYLGQALQRLGRGEEAAPHFAESQRLSAEGTDAEREQLARYLADDADPDKATTPMMPPLEAGALTALSPAQRLALKQRVTAALARSYLNLGILQAQGEHFDAAAELFEKAAAFDPEFPQVQSSLGVAYFNARRFDKATGPLTHALAQGPANPGVKRMLAMAWLDTNEFAKAAELLRDDPELGTDPALQFAYGLSLVKSGRAAEAEPIFSRLLAVHGDTAELSVLLGQAHAQQGDFESAIAALQRALRLKADVVEANATLGVIYLRQGRLPEAEQALRAELAAHPGDLRSQHNLAIVLESQQKPEEAVRLLRGILAAKPETADARYMLGKILLAQGAAAEAVEHLEAAARLAPEDPGTRYQLGQAYQKLGRTEQAQQQFEAFQKLKDKSR